MKSLTWKEGVEAGLAPLVIFVVFEAVWPGWVPFAAAGIVFVALMCHVAQKQKATAEKEAREEKERQERHEKIEMQKHQMTLDRREASRERRRKEVRARATKREETNGQPAADPRL